MSIAQEIEHRYQIEQALRRYCRGVDRGDAELIRSAYHEDAVDDHGGFKGLAHDFADQLITGTKDRWLAAQHLLHQTNIDFDGDRAWVETYFTAHHSVKGDNAAVSLETFGGRYSDRFERRKGTWAIAARTVLYDWSRIEANVNEYPNEQFERGQRSREDHTYQRS